MFPILFQIGPVPIHTYGMLVALGFLGGVAIVKKLSVASQMDVQKMVDFAFLMLVFGVIGSRLLFVITRWEYFATAPLDIFKIWQGGLVFYGGPILCIPFAIWYLKKHSMSVWKVMDIAFPGLAFAQMLGRLGCVSAGCCYGKPTGTEFGLVLHSDLVDPNLRGIPLHPTQLYEASSLGLLVLFLLWIFKNKKFDGQVGLSYLMAYAVIRSIIEIFRGDVIRGFVIENILSTSQFIGIFFFVGAALLMKMRNDAARAEQ